MISLHELTGEWLHVFRQLEDDEADADAALSACAVIEEDIQKKADNYGKIIRMLELKADAARTEAARIQARARTADSRAARLRQQLFDTMKATGQGKLRTAAFTFSISPTPAAVRITDLDAALNAGYIREPKLDESILDKAAMKRDLEAGLTIPGAELVRGETLRMR